MAPSRCPCRGCMASCLGISAVRLHRCDVAHRPAWIASALCGAAHARRAGADGGAVPHGRPGAGLGGAAGSGLGPPADLWYAETARLCPWTRGCACGMQTARGRVSPLAVAASGTRGKPHPSPRPRAALRSRPPWTTIQGRRRIPAGGVSAGSMRWPPARGRQAPRAGGVCGARVLEWRVPAGPCTGPPRRHSGAGNRPGAASTVPGRWCVCGLQQSAYAGKSAREGDKFHARAPWPQAPALDLIQGRGGAERWPLTGRG